MALQKQLIDLPFTSGPDQKTDPIISGKPSRVENMVVTGSTLQKRPGTKKLTQNLDTGGTLTAGEKIFTFDSELVRMNGGKAYSLGAQQNNWTTKPGVAPTFTHTVKRITNKSSNQDDWSHATANGITVTSWYDTNSTDWHIAVYDEATGDFYQTGAAAVASSTNYRSTRSVALGAKILVFARTNANCAVCVIDTTAPETAPSLIVLETDGISSSVGAIDAVAYGNYVVVAYLRSHTGNKITLIAVDGSGSVLSSPAKTDISAATSDSDALLLRIDANGVGYVFNGSAGTFKFLTFSPSAFTLTHANTQILSTASYGAMSTAELTAGQITFFCSGTSKSSIFVGFAIVNSTSIVTAFANISGTHGLVIQSDGFILNGAACCLVVCDTTSVVNSLAPLQPTGFIIDTSGNVYAKFIPGVASNSARGLIAKTFKTSTGTLAMLIAQQGQTAYTSQGGSIVSTTPRGVTRINLSSVTADLLPAIRLGEAEYIGGSQPRAYDGQEIVEAGPNLFPENISVAAIAGSNLGVGVYQYRIVYTWISARGEYQRSAPSPAVSVTISSGANQSAELTIATQALSGRDIVGVSTTQIEIYRTEVNGTNFYRVSSPTSPTLNDITAASIVYDDTSVTDTSLIANELLYTTGGVNDCIAPPAYSIATEHKTRLIINTLDNPYEWRSSSVTIRGQMLRFNESWGGFVPASSGVITGLASMDGNIIIFVEKGAYLIQGDGPDLSGNNNWPDPQLITAVESGTIDAQSVLSTPQGVFYQSNRGLMLLTRSLAVEYVGADVEPYWKRQVKTALAVTSQQQIRYLADYGSDIVGQQQGTLDPSDGGVCLTYDYFYRQWTVQTNQGGQSCCLYQGNFTRVRTDGSVLQEVPGSFGDSGVPVSGTIETQWMKLANIQGFWRLWRALLVGLYGSDFTLTWDAAYDYNPVYSTLNTVTFNGNGIFTVGNNFEIRRHMAQQKCEAVKFRFTDSNIGGNMQGMSLTGLTLEVGTKVGAFKLPAAQST